ncbi:MAG: 3,4-dihydroxy-2-butanone-4-phosphate synthase, partial [Pseudomonadota bacterium]
ARMAGFSPAAVICEIMKDDGTMARLPDLELFAREHGLKIGTIADLIHYRSRHESLIERVAQRTLHTPHGAFEAVAYRDRSGAAHIALSIGHWTESDEVLVRVHEPLSVLDLLDTSPRTHSWPLAKALVALRESGRGVAVLLNGGETGDALIRGLSASRETPPPPRSQMDLRTYGVGAQILRDLGVQRMKLLGSPRRMPSMTGYGLEVTGFVAA